MPLFIPFGPLPWLPGAFRSGNKDLWRLGQSCIKMSLKQIGAGLSKGEFRNQSSRSSNTDMNHPIHRITRCSCIAPYTLALHFADGHEAMVDLEDVLEGEIYGPLRDPFMFAKVSLDPEIGTVVWPNGADFDPAVLHDWPLHREAFVEAAQRWRCQAVPRVAEVAADYTSDQTKI